MLELDFKMRCIVVISRLFAAVFQRCCSTCCFLSQLLLMLFTITISVRILLC